MRARPSGVPSFALLMAVISLVAVGCGDDGVGGTGPSPTATRSGEDNGNTDGGGAEAGASDSTTSTTPEPEPRAVVEGPIESTNPPVVPQPATALPDGYVEAEYFVAGTATSHRLVGTADADGFWTAETEGEADYRTRILVRTPPADRFSGVVVVEWLNVTAIEAAPDWGYLAEEIAHAGHAYVAVSAQALGVVGGQGLLDVSVDEEAAAEAGAEATDVPTGGLVGTDPERYGTLRHPGDAYAFDIYTQVGRALSEGAGDVLGGSRADTIVAVGESQSAGFLTTYVNAVHPRVGVYDAFLVHSRGAGGVPLSGSFGDGASFVDGGVRIRTDLEEPVFMVLAETDLTVLGYHLARQDDTETIRTWELAGTAHADAHVIRSILGGPRDAEVGSLLGCSQPINTGPHHEGVSAAFRHLVDWATEGTAPPSGTRLRLTDGEPVAIVRDELGIALGGVRNPLVDVPVVVTTGDPWDAGSGDGGLDVCALFGRTIEIETAGLVELHGSADAYLTAFDAATDDAVAAGFLLETDAAQLREEARANTARFGPADG